MQKVVLGNKDMLHPNFTSTLAGSDTIMGKNPPTRIHGNLKAMKPYFDFDERPN